MCRILVGRRGKKEKIENCLFFLFLCYFSFFSCRTAECPMNRYYWRSSELTTPTQGRGCCPVQASTWVFVHQIQQGAASVVATFQNNHSLPALGTWLLVILAAMCDRFSSQIPSSPAAYWLKDLWRDRRREKKPLSANASFIRWNKGSMLISTCRSHKYLKWNISLLTQ